MGSKENPERKKEKEKSFWKDNEERIKVDRKDMERFYKDKCRGERREVTQNQSQNYIDNNGVESRT